MAPLSRDSCIRFGRFTMQPHTRSVLIDNAPAPLGSRAFDLLMALANHPGEVLGKRALLEMVWPGVVVEENNLEVQICSLRKLLGPRAILTVPGRGYAFAVPTTFGVVDDASETTHEDGPVDAGMPLRGREAELLAVHELLGSQRLTTIVGPGGVGKTRLARASVPAHQLQFGAGLWCVDLALVPPGSSIASELVRALQLPRRGSAPHVSDIVKLLPNRPLLLVLESCEHVLSETRMLVHEVLQHAPLVHLLLTSQAPLKLRGERVLRLEPLEVPLHPDSPDAVHKPAVALFFDTVQAALNPKAMPGPADVEDVVAICRHLDGMPLAIELAASRVPVLGIQGVRSRLGDRFRMLTSTSREGAPRERSLLASLQWSWRLLSVQEQAVLSAVARFKGQFTIRMAMQALGPLALSEWAAMDALGVLRDKSMVTAAPGRRAAFRLLESTRLFVQRIGGAGDDTNSPAMAAAMES